VVGLASIGLIFHGEAKLIDRGEDFIIVPDDKESLIELLSRDFGVPANEASALKAEEQEQLTEFLQKLADSDVNKGAGGEIRFVVGKRHFQMRKALLTAAIICASFSGSGIALMVNPLVGAPAAVGSVLNAVKMLSELTTKLSVEEFIAFEALVDLNKKRKDANQQPFSNTEKEIEDWFRGRGEAPPPLLSEILQLLGNKKVIRSEIVNNELRHSVVS
jgi:hypothetical protein